MEAQRRRELELQQQKRRHTTELATLFARTLVQTDELPQLVIVVPHLDAEEQPLSDSRRSAFLARLRESVSEATHMAQRPDKADCLNREYASRTEAVASRAVINACSTCRGRCCRNGRDHAFLIAEFLAWRLLNEPDFTPESLFDQYEALIPSQSIVESCVYHSKQGCVLPHSLRGSTCHDFFCTGLLDFPDAIRASENSASVCVAAEGETFIRLGLMTDDGQRTELSLQPSLQMD